MKTLQNLKQYIQEQRTKWEDEKKLYWQSYEGIDERDLCDNVLEMLDEIEKMLEGIE